MEQKVLFYMKRKHFQRFSINWQFITKYARIASVLIIKGLLETGFSQRGTNMKYIHKKVIWLMILVVNGCGTIPITSRYQSSGSLDSRMRWNPPISLRIRDVREKKVFYRSVLGEGADSGQGSLLKLTNSPEEIFEVGFSKALQDYGYILQNDAQLIYEVAVKRFMVIQNDSSTGFDTDIILEVTIQKKGEILANKTIFQRDTDKLPFGKPMQYVIAPLINRSVSQAIEKTVQDDYVTEAVQKDFAEPKDWQHAQEQDTYEAYEKYLADYPNGMFTKKAHDRMDAVLWEEVQASNTRESYQNYLTKNPRVPHVAQARAWLDDLELKIWDDAKTADQRKKYSEYLTQYPEGKYAFEANKRLQDKEEQSWQEAQTADTVNAYRDFIREYSESEHVSQAKKILLDYENRDWQAALGADNENDYNGFLHRYPKSEFAPQAREKLEKLAWDEAQTVNTSERYREFMKQYGKSPYTSEAQKRIDQLDWDQVCKDNTKAAYKLYYFTHSSSVFSDQAWDKVEEFDWQQACEDASSRAFRNFLTQHPKRKYASEARLKLEKLEIQDWDIAEMKDIVSSYEEYLSCHPKGQNSLLAKKRVKQLVDLQREKPDETVTAYEEFLQKNPSNELFDWIQVRCKMMRQDLGEWQEVLEANTVSAYKDFQQKHPNSPFAEEVEARMIDLEIDQIMGGEHGSLPKPTKVSSEGNRKYSIVNIHNDTQYDLTIRYSGSESFKVVFTPQQKGSIELLNGTYRIAASVNAYNIKPFAGSSVFQAGNFEITYYIQSSFELPRISLPTFHVGKKPPFTPWPLRRKLPESAKL
jgi:outer membrane protein assembly factor BamD (BamD/ComL family)